MECAYTMFRTFTMDAVSTSCGLKVIGACHGGNYRTCLWTPVVIESIRVKKEALRLGWILGSAEAIDISSHQKDLSFCGCRT